MSAQINNDWNNFLKLCLACNTQDELEQLFTLFLTSEEKDNLSLRYAIVQQLLQGKKTQRAIAKELKVSIAKITRGSHELKSISERLRLFLTTNIM